MLILTELIKRQRSQLILEFSINQKFFFFYFSLLKQPSVLQEVSNRYPLFYPINRV